MIAPMAKIQIATRARQRDELLAWLQDEEILHIHEGQHTAEAVRTGAAYELAELQFTLEFLQRVRKLTNTIPQKSWRHLFVGKPAASLKTLNQTLASLGISQLATQAHKLHESLNSIEANKEKLQQELHIYMPWQHVRLTGKELNQAKQSHIIHRLLFIPARYEEAWLKSLAHIPTASYQIVYPGGERNALPVACEVIAHRQDEKALASSLATYNTQTVELHLLPEESIIQKINSLRQQLQENEQATQKT